MPTHYKGKRGEVQALNAFIKLLRAAESVTGRLTHFVHDSAGLTLSQFGVLEALLHLGPLSLHQIGEKMLKSGGNITTVIDNLEKRGLVKRRRCSEDRRVIYAHLTAAGEEIIRTHFPKHAKQIEREMSALTAEELAELGRLCKKLGLRKE